MVDDAGSSLLALGSWLVARGLVRRRSNRPAIERWLKLAVWERDLDLEA